MPASNSGRTRAHNRALYNINHDKYHYRGPLNPKIQRLPIELLLEIFLHYRNICENETESRDGVTNNVNPYSWIRITHVCRLWRDVSVSYGPLWSLIIPCEPTALFSTILGRSQKSLLSLECAERYWGMKFSSQALDRILRRELHRVTRISLRGTLLAHVKHVHGDKWLHTLMDSMTSICSLYISQTEFRDLSALSHPKLSHLTLSFMHRTSMESQPTLTTLLSTLSKLPSLTSLHLRNLPAFYPTSQRPERIFLCKLAELRVNGNNKACHDLLRHLDLGQQASVFLYSHEAEHFTIEPILEVIDLFGSLLYPSATKDVYTPIVSLSFIQEKSYINIQGWTAALPPRDFGRIATQEKARFHFKIKSKPEHTEIWMERLLTRLRLQNVEALHICQNPDLDTVKSTWASLRSAIQTVFGNSTSLHTLAVFGMESHQLASLLSYRGPFLKLDSGLFPSLKHVLAEHIFWPNKTHQVGYSVLSALQMRTSLGIPLQKLTLRHCQVDLARNHGDLSHLNNTIFLFVGTVELDNLYLYSRD